MSFNLRYGTAEDGPNSWPFRRGAALETLQSARADVVGLQEVLHFQLVEILAALPGYGYVGVARDDGDRDGEFAPILYDSSRQECIDSGTFWFSDDPSTPGSRHADCYHPRICTWAVFDGERRFAVYNLHLDNESGPSREKSVAQLVASTPLTIAGPVIVTGDFNAGEADPCIEAMRLCGFRDSYRVLHPDGVAGTYHGFGKEMKVDKIDYIWVDSGWTVMESAILTGRVGDIWPSDHYPVTATLGFNGC